MKNLPTFDVFINEQYLNESKKTKFLLYTNPNNITNFAYTAIGSKVKDILNRAKLYPDSYEILYQGTGTNDDLQKAISRFSEYKF